MKRFKILLFGLLLFFGMNVHAQVYQLENTKLEIQNGWSSPSGGYILDGVDDKIALQDQDGIQELHLFVNLSSTTSVSLGTLGTNLTIKVVSGVVSLGSAFTNSTVYVNNVPTTSISTASNYIAIQFDAVSISSGILGYDGTSYGAFTIYEHREFNLQSTTAELAYYYNNGLGKSTIKYRYIGASQTELVTNTTDRDFSGAVVDWASERSGTITVAGGLGILTPTTSTFSGAKLNNMNLVEGKKYRISFKYRLQSGTADVLQLRDPFLGDPDATLTFTPTGTQQTFMVEAIVQGSPVSYISIVAAASPSGAVYEIDDVSVILIGNVLALQGQNAGSFGWVTASGNRLNVTTSGSPISRIKGNEVEYVDYKSAITGATTLTDIVPKGYKLESILFENTTANVITGGMKIGTSSGGTQVVAAETVGANAEGLVTLASDFFSTSADQTLYIGAVTARNSASINLTFRMRRVK